MKVRRLIFLVYLWSLLSCASQKPGLTSYDLDDSAELHSFIQSTIKNRKEFFKACYEKVSKKNKNFSAKINTRIFITPQGKVQNVKMNSSTKNKDFNSCIRDIIYTFNFPKRSDQWIIAIKHPFLFSASNPYGVYDLPLKVPLTRNQIDSSINKKAKILKNVIMGFWRNYSNYTIVMKLQNYLKN